MSGLTNTTGFSFLGLTNLTQGNYDNLFVNNLTANTGTITLLNSTTGNITTLNTTTANITTLLTDLWRGSTASSSMVIGVSGDSGTLTSWRNLIMEANKTITLNATGGKIVCNTYEGTAVGSSISLFGTTTAGIIIGGSSSGITLGDNVSLGTNDNLTLQGTGKITTPAILVSGLTASKMVLTDASKNLVSSSYTDSDFSRLTASNTFTGTTNTFLGDVKIGQFSPVIDKALYFKFHLPLDPTDNVYLSLYQTSGSTFICDTIENGNIHIGNSGNPVLQTGSIFLYGNTDLHSTKKLKLNNTTASKLLLTDASKNVISSAYDETTLPVSTPTQTALNLKANIDNPTFTTGISLTSGNLTISSGTILANTFTGLTTSSSISLFTTASVSSPTITLGSVTGGTFTIRPDTNVLGNTTLSSNLLCNTYRGTAVGSAISLFSSTTAGITLGGVSSGISIADNTTLASGKTLTLNTTGGIIVCDTYNATSISSTLELGKSTTSGQINIGSGLTSGSIVCGKLTMGGFIYLYGDIVCGTSATPKKIYCNSIDNIDYPSGSLNLGGAMTTGSVNIGTGLTTGNVNLGVIGMTGQINCNTNTYIGTSATNKGLVCNYFQSFNVGDLMRYSATSTTGNIRLGESQTSGTITLGNSTASSDSGTLVINKSTTLAANKNLTLGNQSKLVGGSNGSVNITTVAYTNVAVITTASVAGFYEVFIYGASATQTFSVCCFLSADNSGAVQTTASRNMTFQVSGANWCITATVAPTSTISMSYNIVRLF